MFAHSYFWVLKNRDFGKKPKIDHFGTVRVTIYDIVWL